MSNEPKDDKKQEKYEPTEKLMKQRFPNIEYEGAPKQSF